MLTHKALPPVNLLRRTLPRLAAAVLLVWLLAAGSAFAQACASTVHIGCDECCAELNAAPAPTELRQDSPPLVQMAASLFPEGPGFHFMAAPAANADRAWSTEPHPPERIPILFLRLAL